MSGFELAVAVALLFAALLGVIALIDVLRRPAWQWSQANSSRGLWATLLIAGIVFGAFGGLFVAVAYYFFVQPRLKRVSPRIRPPGGSYASAASRQ